MSYIKKFENFSTKSAIRITEENKSFLVAIVPPEAFDFNLFYDSQARVSIYHKPSIITQTPYGEVNSHPSIEYKIPYLKQKFRRYVLGIFSDLTDEKCKEVVDIKYWGYAKAHLKKLLISKGISESMLSRALIIEEVPEGLTDDMKKYNL